MPWSPHSAVNMSSPLEAHLAEDVVKVPKRRPAKQFFRQRGFLYHFPQRVLSLFHHRRVHGSGGKRTSSNEFEAKTNPDKNTSLRRLLGPVAMSIHRNPTVHRYYEKCACVKRLSSQCILLLWQQLTAS